MRNVSGALVRITLGACLLLITRAADAQGDAAPAAPIAMRDIAAVRLAAPPVIDGDLSDSCWEGAARADRFTDELFGTPVPDQTLAFVGYDDKHIYVAFHAHDRQPGSIVARETKRGTRFRGEDTVSFSLDLFRTHKFVDRSFFIVNALGTQYAQLSGGRGSKLEWEGAWQAAAKIGEDGWTAEMAIPWAILNYPPARGPVTCGINFNRYQQRTQIESWWSNLGRPEDNTRDGRWVGVSFPAFRPQTSLLPYTSSGWNEEKGAGARMGLDLRTTLTPSLTLVGTINPDFENVEQAVEGVDFSYGERFVQERRPFFLEGEDIYRSGGVPGRYFYSQRIGGFDSGINLYGKVTPRDTIGLLAALDMGNQADWLLRGRRELGANSSIDFALINRDVGNGKALADPERRLDSNRVLVAGQNWRKGAWFTEASWAGSWVDERRTGSAASASVGYRTPRFSVSLVPYYVRPGFRDDLGLIPFTDYKGVNASVGYFTEWRTGAIREFSVWAGSTNSDRFDGRLFRRQRHLSVNVETRSDYDIEVEWDGGRFEEFNDSVFSVDVQARDSDPFHNFGIGYQWGRRAGDPLTFLTPYVTWRFGDKLTLGLASQILRHTRDREQHILTISHDFSPRQGIGGRIVSQTGGTSGYVAFRQSGYGGVETFLILGDPNERKFTRRLAFKVVWPM
jgi:hypothetical protein